MIITFQFIISFEFESPFFFKIFSETVNQKQYPKNKEAAFFPHQSVL